MATDGRNLCELAPGDAIVIKVRGGHAHTSSSLLPLRASQSPASHPVAQMSPFPVPAVCYRSENEDWFTSVTTNLNWNVREAQKPFTPAPPTPSPRSNGGEAGAASRGGGKAGAVPAPRANM